MTIRFLLISSLSATLTLGASALLACGGEDSGKHMGSVSQVNKSSFTIIDAETRRPMTFSASTSILEKIKASNRRIVVDFEENDQGGLSAVDVKL